MQRAFVGNSPQLRVISSFSFEVFIFRYINLLCVYSYMTTSSLVTSAYNFKNWMYVTFCCLHGKTIRTKCNLKVAFSLNSCIYNKKVIIQLTVKYWNIVGQVPICPRVQYGHLGTSGSSNMVKSSGHERLVQYGKVIWTRAARQIW